MNAVPSMWRTELWHPLVVHFPIALLLVGAVVRLVGAAFRQRPRLRFLVPAGRLMIVLGTIGAWIAVYTGTLADARVVRSLCDPTVVEVHENLAYGVAGLFTAAVCVDALLWTWRRSKAWRRGLLVALAVCLLTASSGLVYVGHLGSRLVYQQAAAVHPPSPDCGAFE